MSAIVATAADVVRAGLRKAILQGEYAPGEQLRQDQLAERFGMSRIPVREALRQLEAEGLVKLHPNRGASVSVVSLTEAMEILELRIALECHALRLSVPHMAEEDFAAAKEVLRLYDEALSPEQWTEMNRRFHAVLYAPCNLPRLLTMIETNHGHLSRFARTQVSIAAGRDRPQREHQEILNACQAGEVERAARLLEAHIRHTQKSLAAAHRRRRSAV